MYTKESAYLVRDRLSVARIGVNDGFIGADATAPHIGDGGTGRIVVVGRQIPYILLKAIADRCRRPC